MTAKLYQGRRSLSLLAPGGTANRVVATTDGALMGMQAITAAMLAAGTVSRGVTRIVAASNASADMLRQADYVCDGVADEVQINAAFAALPASGGTVLLSEGTFTLAAPVATTAAKQTLRGMGMGATILRVVDAAGAGMNAGIVTMTFDDSAVIDLTVDGNKANNAAQTNMRLVHFGQTGGTIPSNRSLVQRVRMLNSAGHGVFVAGGSAITSNSVVRDCVFEGSAAHGAVARAIPGQPMVVSGCTAKGNTGIGFVCDSGPVNLSDCHALGNTSYGFQITSGPTALTNCTAQNGGTYGFAIGGTRTQLTGCQSLSNTNHGFSVSGAQAQLVDCLASAISGNSRGFVCETAATDTLFKGCLSTGNSGMGFRHESTGRAFYIGCQAIGVAGTGYGFWAASGTMYIRSCVLSGWTHGIVFETAGGNHVIDGCRLYDMQYYGWYVGVGITNVQVTNNYSRSVSLVTNNGYWHGVVFGGMTYVTGNTMRDPAAGNRPYGAIAIESGSDSFMGHNDTHGVGVTTQINETQTNLRSNAKLQLDFTLGTDPLNNTALTAGAWVDVCPDQTFRVDTIRGTIEIAAGGLMMVGNVAAVTTYQTRLVIDSAGTPIYVQQGCEHGQATGTWQNPFAGGYVHKLQNTLAVGNHTVKLQVRSGQNGSSYMRGSSGIESLRIQVVEYQR